MGLAPHLLVSVTPHGYGHAAQTAEVVNALRRRVPELRVTLRCSLPRAFLDARFDPPFAHWPEETDFGMRMASAVDVLAEASAAGYRDLHTHWEARVAATAASLAARAPDLLIANIPYLDLAAAARAGIPAVALCSLNWADIHAHYCGAFPEGERIQREIRAAHARVERHIVFAGGMPADHLGPAMRVGPVARLGCDRRAALRARLGLNDDVRLVLLNLGGIAMRLPVENWPHEAGLHWLVPDDWQVRRGDMTPMARLDMAYTDALASVDALVTKVGYGSLVEAACNGIPMLYLPRGDWPEEPYLLDWLRRNARGAAIDRGMLEGGALREPLDALWALPSTTPPEATGAEEAAEVLRGCLHRP